MEEHNLNMEDFGKEKKDQKNLYLPTLLPLMSDFLAPDHYLDLEQNDQVDQGARDHKKEIIEDEKDSSHIKYWSYVC